MIIGFSWSKDTENTTIYSLLVLDIAADQAVMITKTAEG